MICVPVASPYSKIPWYFSVPPLVRPHPPHRMAQSQHFLEGRRVFIICQDHSMASERTIQKSVSERDALGWIHQASCFLCSSHPCLGTFVSPVVRAGSALTCWSERGERKECAEGTIGSVPSEEVWNNPCF